MDIANAEQLVRYSKQKLERVMKGLSHHHTEEVWRTNRVYLDAAQEYKEALAELDFAKYEAGQRVR